MKISGPGSKLPPEGPEAAGETRGAGAGFAERVAKGQTAEGEAVAATRTASAHAVADISAQLEAGRITPQVALERVIDRVVDQQVGPNAPAGIRERVSAALRQALEEDPLLAEKLRSLG
jgi:hypothetical protein